jgi:large subunit ribosomal protein L30
MYVRIPFSYLRPLACTRFAAARSLATATLTRSGISLSKKVQRTLLALGFHKRFQTVYFPHSPEVAGKILRIKELVHVENVSQDMVMTKKQQRQARKAIRGYKIVGSRRGSFIGV